MTIQLKPEEIEEKILEVLAEVLEIKIEKMPKDVTRETIANWDSLGHVRIVLALEEKFGINFDIQEIPNLTSLEAIKNAVLER